MGLEDQAAVKRVADEHESDVVVLLGTPDAESTQTLALTVVAGDPSYAGPLVGVPLGLPVLHVFEPEVRDQVPGDVYEAQVALMETSAGARPYKNGRMGYEAAFGSRLINDPSRRSAVRLSKMTSSPQNTFG